MDSDSEDDQNSVTTETLPQKGRPQGKTIPPNVIAGPLKRYRMIKYVLHRCELMLSERWKRKGSQLESLEFVPVCLDKGKQLM